MVWVRAITVFKKLIPRGEGFVRVVCIVLLLIMHPYSGKYDVGGGNHNYVRWNAHLVEKFFTR